MPVIEPLAISPAMRHAAEVAIVSLDVVVKNYIATEMQRSIDAYLTVHSPERELAKQFAEAAMTEYMRTAAFEINLRPVVRTMIRDYMREVNSMAQNNTLPI